MIELDPKDIQLLAHLQNDSQVSALELSETLGMSASQIGRRKQRLHDDGIIERVTYRLSPKRLGLNVQAFIQIQTESQNETTHSSIQNLVDRTPEIVAAWTLTGDADYIMQVYCTDLLALNELVQNTLLPHPSIGRVHSQIVMQQLKNDTRLPLPRV